MILPKPERRGPKPPRRIRRGKPINPFASFNKAKNLCDDTFALTVRVRDRNRCRLCSSDHNTQCGHLISRRYASCRHDQGNAWTLCSRCHSRWTHDPLGWDELMERAFGPVDWAKRKFAAQIPSKPDYSLMRIPLLLLLKEAIRKNGTCGLEAQVDKLLARHEGRT
jgi:hypothetical protein